MDLYEQTTQDVVLTSAEGQVGILYVEIEHSVQDVGDTLRHQEQPVIISLPEAGAAFSLPEHFQYLRAPDFPDVVRFVIPNGRQELRRIAMQEGFACSSTVEEALHDYNQRFASQQEQQPGPEQEQLCEEQQPGPEQESVSTRWSGLDAAKGLVQPFREKRLLPIVIVFVALVLLVSGTLPFLSNTGTLTKSMPPSRAPLQQVGTLLFESSQLFNHTNTQGQSDMVVLNVSDLPPPRPDMAYYAWLLPERTSEEVLPFLVGTLATRGRQQTIAFSQPQHESLLATYSGVRITEQSSTMIPGTPSQNPKDWRWEGWIPNTPTPGDETHYSLLSHLRHLLVQDPTLHANAIPGGLVVWLASNVSKIEEWASAAQGQWNGTQTSNGDAALIHRHMIRMLDYLDGVRYAWQDLPPGSPWLVDPTAGTFGLLSAMQNQNPPGYLEHVDIHLAGLAGSPGHTQTQKQLAIEVDTVINRMVFDGKKVRKDAALVVKMDVSQLRQPKTLNLLDEMANLTTEVKSGWYDPTTGQNVGGVLWIGARLQQIAVIPVVTSPIS